MIDTHIITGFLGVGKTSVIRHLMAQKPRSEKWVVIVNEFGELGVDGLLIDAADSVVIKQVAGGCACCLALLPFQMSLNQTIKQHRPDRIIIEPSGLGHPDNLIKLLRGEFYDQVLQLAPVITVLDARQLSIPRYVSNEIYNRQLAVADKFVANKQDLASSQDLQKFSQLLTQYQRPGLWVEHGQLAWQDFVAPITEPAQRWLAKSDLLDETYHSVNIPLPLPHNFSASLLQSIVKQQQWQRVKGRITLAGKSVLINWVDGEGDISPTPFNEPYFLEVIAPKPLDKQQVYAQLLTAMDS